VDGEFFLMVVNERVVLIVILVKNQIK